METFLHSVSSVTVILLLTAAGYCCSALGWIGPDAKSFLSKYTMRLALPVMCAYSLRTNLTRELLAQSGRALLVPVFCSVLMLTISSLAGRLMRLPRKSLGVFIMMSSLSNSMFIGYAMCYELFGEACTPYVMIYYLVNTSFVQMVGLTLIRWSGESGRHSFAQSVAAFFKTPPVIGVLVGAALVLFDLHPPAVIMSCAKYINNTVTPMALLLAGHIIREIGIRNIRIDAKLGISMLLRFLVSPAMSLLMCALLGVGGLARGVLAVEAAMPVVTMTVVAAAEYHADEQFAAQGVALSTLACFVVTPILMMLL